MNNLTQQNSTRNGGSLLRPFADLWGADPLRTLFSPMGAYGGIDISRTDSGYSIEMPVAGFTPQDIEVTLEDGVLSVAGKNEKRSFSRSIAVPEEVDAEHIEANVEHGMLTLTLALLPKAQPKKIEVKSK